MMLGSIAVPVLLLNPPLLAEPPNSTHCPVVAEPVGSVAAGAGGAREGAMYGIGAVKSDVTVPESPGCSTWSVVLLPVLTVLPAPLT